MKETLAPEWSVTTWLNTETPLSVSDLRGKVVVLHSFQMLCPGCVLHGLPQAQRIHDAFCHDEVVVVGLHSVFEHHAAMTETALRAFVHEFRYTFPVGIDSHEAGSPLPLTMARYAMRGTPTVVLIDRDGVIRHHAFRREDDLRIGARIAALAGGGALLT
jgi:peroxiredoxin